jgi:vitamin B12 transporter
MKKKIFIVAAVLFSNHLLAQKLATNESDSSQNLDEVVVTANKYPQKQSSTGKVLTVISSIQLENNAGRTLAQVLNEQAGIIINGSQNTLGTNLTVNVRGAGSANTLILVDGMPANDATGISSEFDLNQFAIDQIERVEILKGAQSVLYGSDAVAGVINIITKKQKFSKIAACNVSAAAGSYGTFKAAASVSGTYKAISYSLQYSGIQSNGFSAAKDNTGLGDFDNDDYRQDVLGLNITAEASKNWQLRVHGQLSKYATSLDDAAFTDDKNSTAENKNTQLGLSSIYKLKKGTFTVNLQLNHINRSLNDSRNIPDDPSDYDPYNATYKGNTFFAETYTNLNLHKNIGILFGADIRHHKANILTTYGNLADDSLKATQVSGYASLLIKSAGAFNAELGSRITNHSQFGNAVTYSFNPSYIISKQVKIFANIASGFRSPSLYNLASEYGNNNLKPEKSNSFEAGIQYLDKKNILNVRLTYFKRIIEDIIIFKSLNNPPYGQYDNADKQNDNGIEMEITIHPAPKWNITANYAFVDGKIETTSKSTGKDTSFFNLYRRPKNTFNATIGYQATKKLFASAGFRWVDKRDDLYFNPSSFETEQQVLSAYYTADLYAAYQVQKSVKLFLDIRNITNQEYFDIYGYNNRRFNFMAGVNVNF